ncbi:Translation initiation factor IF-2, partial [Dissostichus eleginoides]
AEAPHNMTAFTGPTPSSSRTLEHWNTPRSSSPPSYRQSPVISKPSSLNTPAQLPHPLLAPNPNPPPHLNPSSPNSYIIHNPYRRPTLPRAPHQPAARTDQPSTSASQKITDPPAASAYSPSPCFYTSTPQDTPQNTTHNHQDRPQP